MYRSRGRDPQVGQADHRCGGRGQLDLRRFGHLLQPLCRDRIAGEVDAGSPAYQVNQVVDQRAVPVVTTEMVVTPSRFDLAAPLAELQQRYVEGTAAEVKHQDGGLAGVV